MPSRPSQPGSDPATERTFAEIARPYQVRTKGRRTFETIHSRDNGPNDGDTLLHKAAGSGAIDDVRDLLRLKAEINALGDMGDMPLHAAARGGHAHVVEILLKAGANGTMLNAFGETPIETAERNGHEDLAHEMRRLIKRGGQRL
ncbi:ankyrin repeat domain-containing protein [Caulobacter segnis]